MQRPVVFVVLGYGCRMTPALRGYLDRVTAAARAEQPTAFIASGGVTCRRSAPGLSEARLIADYVAARVAREVPWVLDEAARTTLENMRNVGALLRRYPELAGARVVLFCDAVRVRKIALLARRLLPVAVELRPCDLARTPLQRAVQQTLAVGYEALALRVPLVERLGLLWVEARMRWS